MKLKHRIAAVLGAGCLIAAGLVGAVAAPAAAGTAGICAYEYQGRCVTWVTTWASCENIFQITTDTRKHRACSIFRVQSIVTVWP